MENLVLLKLIFRNWWRNKLFAVISLVSLVVGISCTNLLISFVEVPQEYAAAVLEAMNHSKIKGRRVNMEPAKNVRN